MEEEKLIINLDGMGEIQMSISPGEGSAGAFKGGDATSAGFFGFISCQLGQQSGAALL